MDLSRWPHADELIDQALSLPVAERARFLERAARGDRELRAALDAVLAEAERGDPFLVPGGALAGPLFADLGRALAAAPATDQSLAAGQELGSYRIIELIGRGGMGEVYRASDSRLGREVALKILSDRFLREPERLARFEREARVLASLSHPHIGSIYDVTEIAGTKALVLELVEGPTLAERLRKGPLPAAEVLDVARQIGEALETAHQRGVIHRDLKPSNVKLTPRGVKVLDFGLAKALWSGDTGEVSPLSTAIARPGAVLGTAAYMSPEQARGERVDHRADIWAFGCVLYEMLTGERAFTGASSTEILARVLERDPDFSRLPRTIPPAVHRLVRGCLEKDPRRRVGWIGDAIRDLQEPWEAAGDERENRGKYRSPYVALAASVLAFICGALLVLLLDRRADPPRADRARYDVMLPQALGFDWPDWPIIAPDGQRLAFTARLQGRRQLWIRRADASTAPLPGTEGATFTFWSPDSRSVAFFAGGKLKKVDAGGGPVATLADAYSVGRGTWSRQGTIVFAPRHNGPLHVVPDSGGPSKPVTALDANRGETSHHFPNFLPDGRHFLYAAAGQDPGVRVGSLDGTPPRDVLRTLGVAWFSEPGVLVFNRQQTLMAQPFNLATFTTEGTAVAIAEPVAGGAFSLSENGTLAFRPGGFDGSQLVWIGRDGQRERTVGEAAPYQQVVLSPSGRRAAVQRVDAESGNADIWVVDLDTGIASRLTLDPAMDGDPVWSPDERTLAFTSFRQGHGSVYQYDLGSGREQPLFELPASEHRRGPPDGATPRSLAPARIPEGIAVDDWTSDGRWLVVRSFGAAVYAVPMLGDRVARLLADTPYVEDESRVSPDRRAVAFNSDESGQWEVYVATFPAFTEKRQVSHAGGMQPRWRRDSSELFYLSLDGTMMSAPITTSPQPVSQVPRPLFKTMVSPSPNVPQYDVAPDGARFLVLEPAHPGGEPITFVLNWATALER